MTREQNLEAVFVLLRTALGISPGKQHLEFLRNSCPEQLVKVTTARGEDWVYLSGKWDLRPDGDQPATGIYTDADILAWRVEGNKVTRLYLAGGSYAVTPYGSWDFGSQGNHYIADNDGI